MSPLPQDSQFHREQLEEYDTSAGDEYEVFKVFANKLLLLSDELNENLCGDEHREAFSQIRNDAKTCNVYISPNMWNILTDTVDHPNRLQYLWDCVHVHCHAFYGDDPSDIEDGVSVDSDYVDVPEFDEDDRWSCLYHRGREDECDDTCVARTLNTRPCPVEPIGTPLTKAFMNRSVSTLVEPSSSFLSFPSPSCSLDEVTTV